MVDLLGLQDAKGADTPGTKTTGRTPDTLNLLPFEEAAMFRTGAGLGSFIAEDRWDVKFAVKTLASGLKSPTVGDMARLKRLARYLKEVPGITWYYGYQRAPKYLDVYCDSDWQGDEKTRRSTSAVIEMFGIHPIDTVSVTQETVALASAEAELKAINRGMAGGLQTGEVYEAFGMKVMVRALSDSSAGRAMIQRRGGGKAKHIQARELWMQEKLRRKEVELEIVSSEENPSDVGTKYLAANRLLKATKTVTYRLSPLKCLRSHAQV